MRKSRAPHFERCAASRSNARGILYAVAMAASSFAARASARFANARARSALSALGLQSFLLSERTARRTHRRKP